MHLVARLQLQEAIALQYVVAPDATLQISLARRIRSLTFYMLCDVNGSIVGPGTLERLAAFLMPSSGLFDKDTRPSMKRITYQE